MSNSPSYRPGGCALGTSMDTQSAVVSLQNENRKTKYTTSGKISRFHLDALNECCIINGEESTQELGLSDKLEDQEAQEHLGLLI